MKEAATLLKWATIGGILLTLFLPLFVANSLFFPFITGKAFAFRIIVEIVAGSWLAWCLVEPSVRPKKSLALYAAGAFLLSLLVSVFLSANPDKSFWSNFERMEGWIGIAHVILYFTVVLSVFTEKTWKWFWNTAIAASVVQGLYGLGQLFGWFTINQGGVRLDGQFGNATYLAIYMLFSFFFTLLALYWWGGWKGTARWLSAYYVFAALLQAAIIFFTATRGTILGLIGGLLLAGAVIAFTGTESRRFRKWGVGIITALVILAGGFYAIENTHFVQTNDVLTRLASIDTPQKLLDQGSTRFAIWSMAWQGFLERPLFGWGQESFNYVFNAHYQGSLYKQEPWFDRAHNEFLDWMVAGGSVALVLWLSFFALALYYLWRKESGFSTVEQGLLTGLLAGYAFHDLFVFDNLFSYVYFFSVLAYIAWRSGTMRSPQGAYAKPVSDATFATVAPFIAVICALVLYFVNVPGIAAASDVIQGLSPHTAGLTVNLAAFKQAVNDAGESGLGAQEVHEQLVQFAAQVQTLNAGDAQFQQQVAQYAATEMGNFIATAPNDARTRLFYGSYLLQIGDTADAETQLTAAHALSPQKQQVLFSLSGLEMAKGNLSAALSYAKQAYDLAPAYSEAASQYAAAAIRSGNSVVSTQVLQSSFGTRTPDDDVVLAAYLAVKDYADALTILKNRVAANPNDYKLLVNLAAGYLQAGDNADAIAEVQKAISLEPSFAAQGQAIIQGIQSGQLHP